MREGERGGERERQREIVSNRERKGIFINTEREKRKIGRQRKKKER